jgi:SAM-dependent methyltransferase
MQNTPMHDRVNHNLLGLVPEGVERVVEVGCSSGAMGAAFLAVHPQCEYIGIEVVPEFAEVARARCSEVMIANIEQMEDRSFEILFPIDCWIFGDVLEHLYDPWKALTRLRASLSARGCVVACIPNAQHWSVQGRLNSGRFRYEDEGLLDRTHIRWFTRRTIIELFDASGFEIEKMGGRVFEEGPARGTAMPAIRAFAQALGEDPDVAEQDAMPIQYLVRARPRATPLPSQRTRKE